MTGTPIQLRDRGGRVVFEGTQDGGGGSIPQIGRPKSSDADTFYGVPFASSQIGWGSGGFGGAPGGDATVAALGKTTYVPLPVLEAISLTAFALSVEDQSSGGDVNAHVGIVAADADWQPTGDALAEATITVPDGTTGPQFIEHDLGSPVTIPAGMYLVLIEVDGPITIDYARILALGSYICAGVAPGALVSAMNVTHAFGPYTGPLPTWATADLFSLGVADSSGQQGLAHTVMLEWDPA